MTDARTDNSQVKAEAAAVLRRLQTASYDAARAGSAIMDDAARARLDAIIAQLSGAESALASEIDNPTYRLRDFGHYVQLADSASAAVYVAEASGKSSDAKRAQEVAATFAAINREAASFAHDLFGRRPFDPFLQFDSEKEREEYERRRKERENEVNQHLAAGTPEGNLHALTTMSGQMLDDAQHGAANSPEFEGKWNKLQEQIRRQKEAMRAAGMQENDINKIINDDLRKELHRMGRPAEEIDQIMSSPNPMSAAKEQITHAPDVMNRLGKSIAAHQSAEAVPENVEQKREADLSPLPPHNTSAEAAAGAPAAGIPTAQAEALNFGALLNAAGITTDTTPSTSTGHGLNVAQTSTPNRGQGNSPI